MASAIRQMPVAVFLFFTALPLLAAAGCLFGVTRARRQAAVITATPTSNIGMAHDGYCELEGRSEAIDGQLLTAPLTKAACVWYSAKVEQWIRRSKMDSEGQ